MAADDSNDYPDTSLLDVSGIDKMRITGRLRRIATLTTELTELLQETHADLAVLKAKADAYDKMARTFRGIKEET